MATVRPGRKAALLVVDAQAGVVAQAWEPGCVVGRIARAVERARQAGLPVLWVQHENDELPRGSAAWQWAAPLAPATGEAVVPKQHNSAFEDTALEATLAARGVSHVVLAGAESAWCIRATAYGALERGYDLTLLADAHTTAPLQPQPGVRIEAKAVVDDLNLVMTWLSYPGRRNQAVPVDQMDFAAAAAG